MSAPQPPMEVPATRSKHSAIGLPITASISSTITIRLRPRMPPPSCDKGNIGSVSRQPDGT
eukprot:scaffold24263_cov69-Phaeocystis_antarctica.AAC.6